MNLQVLGPRNYNNINNNNNSNHNNKERICLLVDATIPSDRNVMQKEAEKKLKNKI
jgi:hypothetical protein